jgi:hypothetical protein
MQEVPSFQGYLALLHDVCQENKCNSPLRGTKRAEVQSKTKPSIATVPNVARASIVLVNSLMPSKAKSGKRFFLSPQNAQTARAPASHVEVGRLGPLVRSPLSAGGWILMAWPQIPSSDVP